MKPLPEYDDTWFAARHAEITAGWMAEARRAQREAALDALLDYAIMVGAVLALILVAAIAEAL